MVNRSEIYKSIIKKMVILQILSSTFLVQILVFIIVKKIEF